MTDTLRIGELAERTGVEAATLRYYEHRGVLAAPGRSPSGYRRYPKSAVDRVRFIRRARSLGFSLEAIRDLISLRGDADGARRVRDLAEAKLAEIRAQIRDLRAMERDLRSLTEQCDGRGSGRECVILGALEGER